MCSVAVTKCDQRRNLANPASQHVVATFVEFVGQLYPQWTVAFPTNDSFACLPCFRSLEKLLKLRKNAREIESKLEENLKRVAERLDSVSEQGTSCTVTTPRSRRSKRPAGKDTTCSTPRAKRRRPLDTPTRTAIQRLQPSGPSPLVAVGRLYSSVRVRVHTCS